MNSEYLDVSSRTYYAYQESDQPDEVRIPSRQFIQALGLNEPSAETPQQNIGFWRRQFQDTVTIGQKKFDWLFGVTFPVICFAFDPIVFKSSFGPGDALLGAYAPFAYLLSFVSIMATMAWLLWGESLKWLNAFLAGLFAVGALAALVIGIILTPYSLMGLIILIGALGFTPLLTSFVFFRNSVRAFRAGQGSLEKGVLINSFLLGAIASVVIPYLFNLK